MVSPPVRIPKNMDYGLCPHMLDVHTCRATCKACSMAHTRDMYGGFTYDVVPSNGRVSDNETDVNTTRTDVRQVYNYTYEKPTQDNGQNGTENLNGRNGIVFQTPV